MPINLRTQTDLKIARILKNAKIIFATVSSSLSAWWPWLTEAVVLSFLAVVGGVLVYVGLSLERRSEKSWYSNIEDFRSRESDKQRGWSWLMWGIRVEIITALVFALISVRDDMKNASNNPLNQEAQSAKATVFLWTEGTNIPPMAHDLPVLLSMSSKLAFGSPELMKTGAPNLFSPFLMHWTPPAVDGTNMRWRITFDRNDQVFLDCDLHIRVSEAIDWRKFELGVTFLPVGTKLKKAEIILTVNDTSVTNVVGSRAVRSSDDLAKFWDKLTNGTEVFNEISWYNSLTK